MRGIAAATGIAERTPARKADLFDAAGMASLLEKDARSPAERRHTPADVRRCVPHPKAEYRPFHPREIAAIRGRRDDCRIQHSTVQRIFATNPVPAGIIRRYPSYRSASVALYFDGWNIASMAGYLETNRPWVYETLYRFFSEEFAGLADKSCAPKRPARNVDFETMAAVRRLQANPQFGEFRIHAALKQLGGCSRVLESRGRTPPRARHSSGDETGGAIRPASRRFFCFPCLLRVWPPLTMA